MKLARFAASLTALGIGILSVRPALADDLIHEHVYQSGLPLPELFDVGLVHQEQDPAWLETYLREDPSGDMTSIAVGALSLPPSEATIVGAVALDPWQIDDSTGDWIYANCDTRIANLASFQSDLEGCGTKDTHVLDLMAAVAVKVCTDEQAPSTWKASFRIAYREGRMNAATCECAARVDQLRAYALGAGACQVNDVERISEEITRTRDVCSTTSSYWADQIGPGAPWWQDDFKSVTTVASSRAYQCTCESGIEQLATFRDWYEYLAPSSVPCSAGDVTELAELSDVTHRACESWHPGGAGWQSDYDLAHGWAEWRLSVCAQNAAAACTSALATASASAGSYRDAVDVWSCVPKDTLFRRDAAWDELVAAYSLCSQSGYPMTTTQLNLLYSTFYMLYGHDDSKCQKAWNMHCAPTTEMHQRSTLASYTWVNSTEWRCAHPEDYAACVDGVQGLMLYINKGPFIGRVTEVLVNNCIRVDPTTGAELERTCFDDMHLEWKRNGLDKTIYISMGASTTCPPPSADDPPPPPAQPPSTSW